MKALIRYRSRRVSQALRCYDTGADITECLVDFLADARHWCDRHRLNYAELDASADEHYSFEVATARELAQ